MANDKGTETVCSARRGGEWQLHFDRFGYVEIIYLEIVTPLLCSRFSTRLYTSFVCGLSYISQICKI